MGGCDTWYDGILRMYQAGDPVLPYIMDTDCSKSSPLDENTGLFASDVYTDRTIYIPSNWQFTNNTQNITFKGDGFYAARNIMYIPGNNGIIPGADYTATKVKTDDQLLTDMCMTRTSSLPVDFDWEVMNYKSNSEYCDVHMKNFCQTTGATSSPYSEDCYCLVEKGNFKDAPISCVNPTCNKLGYKTADLRAVECSPAICRNTSLNSNIFCDGDYVGINGVPDDFKAQTVKTLSVNVSDTTYYILLAAITLICFILIILFA